MQEQRLLDSLAFLAKNCNDTPWLGVTRFSWSAADRKARRYISAELEKIGITAHTDGIGNIHGIYKGKTDKPAIVIGSHLDTVKNGGNYDGTYGVAAALEVLRSLYDKNHIPERDIEFIAFAEEEGSNFGNTCLGSKAITGQISENDLKSIRNKDVYAWDLLRQFGLQPQNLIHEQVDPQKILAFLEIHIEQNEILYKKNIPLGIVTAICGMRLYAIRIEGRSDHAASPMQGRTDPMAAFAEIAYSMEKLWKDGVLPEDFSCTIGNIRCLPNAGIVIPSQVDFTIDIRHIDIETLEKGWKRIEAMINAVQEKRNIRLTVERLSASGGTAMAEFVKNTFAQSARELNAPVHYLQSGPAHDAASMGHRVPVGLLFVPSIDGLSHCPEENTSPEHLILGAKVFENAVLALAEQK